MNIRQTLQNKRVRFFIVVAILTALMVVLSLPSCSDLIYTLLLPAAAVLLTYFALGRLGGIEVVTLYTLPVLLAIGASLNQWFFPNFSLLVKIGIWASFFSLYYVLLLALNVFHVERLRGEKIPLEKAAEPAVLLISFLVAVLLITVIYKFALGVGATATLIFLVGFILALNVLWFFSPSDLFTRSHFAGAIAVGLGVLQISLTFSFFPLKAHLLGLSQGVFFYSILGVVRAYFEKHLRYRVLLEYILLSLGVFIFVQFL
ncbi:hypothetical protein GTO10_06965 [Candidatus Saccharibacteria bacterium]|nr:hypothetical protein [Candidatus Saccharibacteria bacterium]